MTVGRGFIEKKKRVGLLLLDLDNFKQVNDKLGHDTGDLLLKYVARVLNYSLPKNCSTYRLGGDEFVVLVENAKDDKELEEVAHIILKGIANPHKIVNTKDKIEFNQDKLAHILNVIQMMNVTSSSIGGAIFPDNAKDKQELYKKADKALYYTKGKGNNGYTAYSSMKDHYYSEI
ncbi:GGDEF domain-containing protein [Bacillus sp. Marseille-P3661]|uniref:GGDEF domain-containing protein n=1 Tax=Bacillus sp. Marseille-P3661 TaxID=1936234 RepID=UPI000C85F1D8|nr:GGDEF domain-containing protein [Bacillus sp. Marseille-P3661]